MDLTIGLTGVLWIAIGAGLVAAAIEAWCTALSGRGPLPFFRELEAHGVTLAQAEQLLGTRRFAEAVRRCALCRERSECERGARVACPNDDVLRRAEG